MLMVVFCGKEREKKASGNDFLARPVHRGTEQTALAAVSSDPSVITLLTFTVAIPDGLLITRIHREK